MGYRSRWTATDQVPQRLVDAGTYNGAPFSRFSSLDPTAGGDTSRNSVSAEWHANGAAGRSRLSAYAIQYRLDLSSNFTYALERPADGDQFTQRDQRHISGLDASHRVGHRLAGWDASSEFGLSVRQDRVRVGLYDSVARRLTATVREDEVRETLTGFYAQTAVDLSSRLRAIVGLRADHVDNRVDALTLTATGGNNGGRSRATQLSPKLSLIARPLDKTEFFFNAGRGLHSNDARGTTTTQEPLTGSPVAKVPPLVASRGYEIGARTEAVRGLQSSIALWKLDFDSELVYVGDAGFTEASGASTRRGVEINNRWVPVPWFLLDADLAWTHARFRNGDRIPNAVDRVASVAVTLRELQGWSASLQWRYLGSGALVEDNSVRAQSSLTTNLRLAYQFGPRAELTLDVFNLMNRWVNDIQYLYESQLPGEAAPVTDRHVHPAEPRSARLSFQLRF
jgi:outer membrane receptor for Fe3+-dicitrate